MAHEELDEDQAAVYDRQLRVWGVEVQQKLNAARVLIVGFNKTAAEIAKNIVLAGVGQVTLAADGPASAHAGANFLIPTSGPAAAAAADEADATAAAVAARTLQELHPLVRVVALPGGEAAVQAAAAAAAEAAAGGEAGADDDDPVFGAHDLVAWCGAGGGPTALAEAARADAACRARGRLFMAAAVSGHAGYCFCDFGPEYTFRPKENEAGGAVAAAPAAGAAEAKTTEEEAADASAPRNNPPLPAEQTVAFSTLAAALAAPLGGLHANAHSLFPVLCASAAVQARAPGGAPPAGEAGAREVERELASGALGSSPGGPALLVAAVDLARAYVGQAGAGAGGGAGGEGGADPLSVMREYAPAAAIVGAVAANAALRAVSRSGAPLRNAFFYSCADGRGLVEDQPALAEGLQAGAAGGNHQQAGGKGAADAAVEVVLD